MHQVDLEPTMTLPSNPMLCRKKVRARAPWVSYQTLIMKFSDIIMPKQYYFVLTSLFLAYTMTQEQSYHID